MKTALIPAFVGNDTQAALLVLDGRSGSAAETARELLAQAKAASLQNLRALQRAIRDARERAQAVGSGGDLYPWSLEDFARRLGEDLLWREKTLQLLIERQQSFSALPQDAVA